MELKTFPPSFITANIPSPFPYHKSYPSAIISFSTHTLIQSHLIPHIPPTSTTPYIPHTPRILHLNNEEYRTFSLVIEYLKSSDMNTDFISSIITYMLLPDIYIL